LLIGEKPLIRPVARPEVAAISTSDEPTAVVQEAGPDDLRPLPRPLSE